MKRESQSGLAPRSPAHPLLLTYNQSYKKKSPAIAKAMAGEVDLTGQFSNHFVHNLKLLSQLSV